MAREIFSATGEPFTDLDAAQFKANIISRELGETFMVSPVPGGYVITPEEVGQQPEQIQIPVYPENTRSNSPYDEVDITPTPGQASISEEEKILVKDEEGREEQKSVYTPIPEADGEKDLYAEYAKQPYMEKPEATALPEVDDIKEQDVPEMDEDSTTREFGEKFAGKLSQAAEEADERREASEREERETMKEVKLKPAWRSQWHYGILVFIGLTIIVFPTLLPVVLLGVGETQAMIQEYPWALDGMRLVGVSLAGFSLYKALGVILAYDYRITPTTVTAREGILARNKIRIDIANIVNLELTQTAQERMIGVGNIEISSAGTGDVDLCFRLIESPVKIHDIIRNRIEVVRTRMRQNHK